MSAIRCVANPHAVVGEGPVWDDRRQVLWWIDVKQPRLFRYDPASGDNR
jgi:sugar lactone lactonase YvrE